MKQEALDQLPIRVIKARRFDGTFANILVDGDYDGEWFEELNEVYGFRVYPNNHVAMRDNRVDIDERTGLFIPYSNGNKFIYLHQLVLPPKKGYWTFHKNRNFLDCRSANLEYKTPKEIMPYRHYAPHTPTTHCKRGHEFNEENTYVVPKTGARICRKCDLIRSRKYHANKRRRIALLPVN